ncbi:MAG: conjugative transposon protein TraM [Bacteroidales bacterium]|jgi:conjugative transposon TraM protein|nr:conjugative transposon protein TraM [Bacteroidales bacterium]
MEQLKKINFKQPKYMLPAILYFPILFTGYFVIDMFYTEKAEIEDPTMQSTEYLNPNLPQAKVKDELDGKYESMLKSYGKIDDFSAIENIDSEEEEQLEEYESQYTETDLESLDSTALAAQLRAEEMQRQLQLSAERGNSMQDGEMPLALSETERLIQELQREKEMREGLERALAQAREAGQNATETASQAGEVTVNGTITYNENAINTPSDNDETQEVVKRTRQTSDFFNTLSENEPQSNLIKAIIDEDIKAVDGSRVRLRLLDDIEIGSVVMPKGSYIYAIMSGFGSQRVKGSVKSLLYKDELIKVSLSIYDTDGLEGLYVPSSSFRETSKEVASSAMSGNISMNQGSYDNSLAQWGMQAIQNAYQRTTNAISKSIKKNSAKLKYGTFVYLVNGKEKNNE